MAKNKENWISSDFTFDEIEVGMEVINGETKQVSRVIGKTSNTIEVFNTADQKSRDQDGKLKGIDSSNWYNLDGFNRTFTRWSVNKTIIREH